MSQVFIQTDSRVVDVSKITWMRTEGASVTVHFVGGSPMIIPLDEADALMTAMANLRSFPTICARTKPAIQTERKSKRREAKDV